jgi:hypothetical protein
VTTLHDFGGVLGRPLDTFLLSSHNLMVTALGSCVKWPSASHFVCPPVYIYIYIYIYIYMRWDNSDECNLPYFMLGIAVASRVQASEEVNFIDFMVRFLNNIYILKSLCALY